MPAPRAGADVLGATIDAAWIPRWLDSPLVLAGEGAAKATLIRWWTDTCSFCEASLPALDGLRVRYAARGLRTLAIYHPKPPREVTDDAIRTAADEFGYFGPLAADPEWAALERIWNGTGTRSATSVSFLVDSAGRIRFVHPGPVFHAVESVPGLEDHAAVARSDYAALEQAIESLLAED
jgi:hypothetical protein